MTASSPLPSARRARMSASQRSCSAGRSTSRARKRSARKSSSRCRRWSPPVTTPLENVPGLGEGLVEKLGAAGVTTVEALADMTPEQLEAIEGIGPKTVEKISLAVNNYFASLEAGVVEGEVTAEGVIAEGEPGTKLSRKKPLRKRHLKKLLRRANRPRLLRRRMKQPHQTKNMSRSRKMAPLPKQLNSYATREHFPWRASAGRWAP